jgi:hypothetical protein
LPEEQESTETEAGENEVTTEPEQTSAQQASEGCGSVLSATALILPALGALVLIKKKKQA